MKSCFFLKKVISTILLITISITMFSSCTIFKNNFPSGYAFFNNSLGFDEEFDEKDIEKIKKKQQEEKKTKEEKKKIEKRVEENDKNKTRNIKKKEEITKDSNSNEIKLLKQQQNTKLNIDTTKKNKDKNIKNSKKQQFEKQKDAIIKQQDEKVDKNNKDKNKDNNNKNKEYERKENIEKINNNQQKNNNIYYKTLTENNKVITEKQNNKSNVNSKQNTTEQKNNIEQDKQASKQEKTKQQQQANSFFIEEENEINNISNKANYKHFGIVISGPSGVGKTTIVNELIKRNNNLVSSISATTREKRKNETDGVDYYFIPKNKFQELALNNEFLEYSSNYDNSYGTPKRNYFDSIDEGKDIVFTLNLEGMLNIKNNTNLDIVSIYILPSTFEELKKRLTGRKTETKEQMEKRLKSAQNEINKANGLYDYIVYNYDLENAISTVNAIYLAEQRKREILE